MGDLVGREMEQARLSELLERAGAGDGGLTLIRGEAGIGKTALARFAERQAAERGFVTLRGRCHPNGSEVSYGPLVEAIGRVFRSRNADELRTLTERIAGLSLLFPGQVDEPDLTTIPEELALTRTLEAIRGILVRLASVENLLLVIDDVQWADEATLRALAHIAGELEVAPIAVVLTLRDGEADRSVLRTMLTALRRSCAVDELTPTRLDEAATGRILATIAGNPVAAEVVAEIHRRAAGTPLFVESLGREFFGRDPARPGAAALSDRAATMPAAIRDVVAERLQDLGEDATDVLAAVAVASTSVDLSTVQRVTQLDDGPFAAAVERLLARRLVTVGAGPEAAVETAHPLIAEVAERRLAPPELARLHARHLAVLGDDVDPEVAALHVLGAGDRVPVDQALRILEAAATQAAARQAHRSTAAHAARALDLVAPLHRPETERSIRRVLAGALLGLGHYAEAGEVAGAALALPFDDPVVRLPAIGQAEIAAWLTDSGTAELDRLDAALADLPAGELRPEVLRSLELRLSAHARRGSPHTAAHVEDLIARTADRDEPAVSGLHLVGLAYRHELAGDHHRAIPVLEQILDGEPGAMPAWLVHRANIVLVDCLTPCGPVDRLRLAAAALTGDSDGLYLSWRDHIIHYRCGLAQLEPGCLDLEDPSPIAFGARSSASWPNPLLLAHRAWLLDDRDALDQVAEHVAERRRRYPDRGAVLAEVEVVDHVRILLDDDPDSARARLAARGRTVALGQLGRESMEFVHRLATVAGDADVAIEIEAALRRLDGGTGWASAQARYLTAGRLVAGVETATGTEPAEIVLIDAADHLERLGDRHRMADALTMLAERTGTVDPRLPSLLAGVEAVGLTSLAERMGRALGPAARREAGHRPALTRRQTEIAELVAEGLTNAAIADRLFISIRTVTSHLDHIYTKLGISNRTELAVLLPELR